MQDSLMIVGGLFVFFCLFALPGMLRGDKLAFAFPTIMVGGLCIVLAVFAAFDWVTSNVFMAVFQGMDWLARTLHISVMWIMFSPVILAFVGAAIRSVWLWLWPKPVSAAPPSDT